VPNSQPATKLSVCVPTHDGRARELGQLIERLEDQVSPALERRVEVCISDGASQDRTATIVEQARARGRLAVRYRRSAPDRGLIAHLLESVEMATAPHCWLMSSDDAPADGGIEGVLAALAANPGVAGLSVGFDVTDKLLDRGIDSPTYDVVRPREAGSARRFSDRAQTVEELGLLFISLSAHVVDRETWLAAVERGDAPSRRPLRRLCGHMQVLGRMLDARPSWAWCPSRLVLLRSDNDSWRPRHFDGDLSRYWRAVLGDLEHVYAEICGGRGTRGYRLSVDGLRRLALEPREVLWMKMQSPPPPSLKRDIEMLLSFGWLLRHDRGFWRRSLPTLLLPHQLAPRAWLGKPLSTLCQIQA
jgi:abequosyltransferase